MTDARGPEEPRKPLVSRLSETISMSSVGLEIGLSVAIGALGGYWLDEKLSTGPWLTLVGLLFGVAAAAKRVIEITRLLSREEKRRDEGEDTDAR
jgi:F0F1-type ATP synthase assembly protein I